MGQNLKSISILRESYCLFLLLLALVDKDPTYFPVIKKKVQRFA